MGWSWTVATIRGIPIKLHFTLLFFLPIVAFFVTAQFQMAAAFVGVEPRDLFLPPAVWGALLAVALFFAILLHELAHSLVAISNNVKVHSITLMMLGGVSRILGDIPQPGREAWMAAAGPLTSFVISIISFGIYFLLRSNPGDVAVAALVFGWINLVLAVFNLLPAFPMDGGRVLRASLTPVLGRLRATRVAANIGKGMAVVLGVLGIFVVNPFLVVIAVFVFFGASAEASGVETRYSLMGVRIGSLMDRRLGQIPAHSTVGEAADYFLQNNLMASLVIESTDDRPGLLTYQDLKRASSQNALQRVGEIARKKFVMARPEEDVGNILPNLQGEQGAVIVVVSEQNEPIGVVTSQDLMRAALLYRSIAKTRGKQS